ncbi:hypothetical protein BH11GEM2_BH11GEM2_38190 [soil metagenome]
MTTTLRAILQQHDAARPLVYLNDGGTSWDASTLLEELDNADESRPLLDAEDEYVVGEHGILRLDEHGYLHPVPAYAYQSAWTADVEPLTSLEALRDAAVQYGELDSSMPSFGGDAPATLWAWSWDTARLLVGTCIDDLKIVDRADYV